MASAARERRDAPATDLAAVSAAVDRLTRHSTDWTAGRLLDEGLDLVRDVSWADASALMHVGPEGATVLHRRPGPVDPSAAEPTRTGGACAAGPPAPLDWFPWGLGPIRADRFLLVEDARALPSAPGDATMLGALGVRSCLHLPLRQRGRSVGAIQVFWSEPRLAWDDDRGRLLRTLGRFLLTSAERRRI